MFNYPFQLPSNVTKFCDRLAQEKCLCGKWIVIHFFWLKNIPHNFNSCHISDVDECRENVGSCDPYSETCINEIGSYRCEPITSSIRNESRTPYLRSADTRQNNEENRVDVCPAGYSYSYSRKVCLGNVYFMHWNEYYDRYWWLQNISGTTFGYEHEFLQCYATIPYCRSCFSWVNNVWKPQMLGEYILMYLVFVVYIKWWQIYEMLSNILFCKSQKGKKLLTALVQLKVLSYFS